MNQAQHQMARYSKALLTATVAATAHVRVTADTGANMEPPLKSCTLKAILGGGVYCVDWVFHGRYSAGGCIVGTGLGDEYSASAIVGVDSFPGQKGGGGGAPAVAQESRGLRTSADNAGVRLEHGTNDDIIVTQEEVQALQDTRPEKRRTVTVR